MVSLKGISLLPALLIIVIGCSTPQLSDTTQQRTDNGEDLQQTEKPAPHISPSDIQRHEKVVDALSDMENQLQQALKQEISDTELQDTVRRIISQFYEDKYKEDEIFRLIEEEIARRYGKATAKVLKVHGDIDKDKMDAIAKIFAELKQKEELTAQKVKEGIKREEELAKAKELARERAPLSATKDRERKIAELEKARKLIEEQINKELSKESGASELKRELAELDKKILAERSLLEADQLREKIVRGDISKERLPDISKVERGASESERERKIAELEKRKSLIEQQLNEESRRLAQGSGDRNKYNKLTSELAELNKELTIEKAFLDAEKQGKIAKGGSREGNVARGEVDKEGRTEKGKTAKEGQVDRTSDKEKIAKSGKGGADRSREEQPSEVGREKVPSTEKSASELEQEQKIAELEKRKAEIEQHLADEAKRSKESGIGLSNEYKKLEKELSEVEKELEQERKIAELERKKRDIEQRIIAEEKRSKEAGEGGISNEQKGLEKELSALKKKLAEEKHLLADLRAKRERAIAADKEGEVAKVSKEPADKRGDEASDRLKKMEEEIARKEKLARERAERQKWLDDIKRARALADSRGQGGSDEEEEGVGGEKGPLAGRTPSDIEKSATQIERERKIAELEKMKAEIEHRLANEAKRSQDRGESPTDEYKKLEKELSEVKRELEREHKIAELEKTKDGLERRLTEEAKKLSGGKEGQDGEYNKIKEELADVNKKLAIEKILLEAEQRQKGIVKGGDAGGGSSGGQTPDVQKGKEGITPPDEVGKSGQDKGVGDSGKGGIKPEDNNIAKGGDRPIPGDVAKPIKDIDKPDEGQGGGKEGGENGGSGKEGGELLAKGKEGGKQTPAEVDKGKDAGSVDKKDVSEQEREQRVAELEKAKAVLERQLVEEIKKVQELGQGAPADGVEALKNELSKVEKMLEEEREQLLALRRERGDASGGQDKKVGKGGGEVGKGVGAEGRDGKIGGGHGGDGLGGGPLPGDEEFLLFEEKWADVIKRVRSTLRKYYEETGK